MLLVLMVSSEPAFLSPNSRQDVFAPAVIAGEIDQQVVHSPIFVREPNPEIKRQCSDFPQERIGVVGTLNEQRLQSESFQASRLWSIQAGERLTGPLTTLGMGSCLGFEFSPNCLAARLREGLEPLHILPQIGKRPKRMLASLEYRQRVVSLLVQDHFFQERRANRNGKASEARSQIEDVFPFRTESGSNLIQLEGGWLV